MIPDRWLQQVLFACGFSRRPQPLFLSQFCSYCTAGQRLWQATYRQDSLRPIPVTGGEPCRAPAFLKLSPCLTGPVYWLFASCHSSSHSGGVTHTIELGLPFSTVSLQCHLYKFQPIGGLPPLGQTVPRTGFRDCLANGCIPGEDPWRPSGQDFIMTTYCLGFCPYCLF